MAYLPSMPDQIDMQRVDPLGRRDLRENLVGLVRADIRPNQAQAFADAVYMRINRHNRPIQVEHKYACRCFGSNSWDTSQVSPGLF